MANDLETRGFANPVTLGAMGVIAYVSETLLHEAGGHGLLCLLTGGRITLLAPLYMRCSVVTGQMVAAGPGMNLLAGLISLIVLHLRRERTDALQYFVWLCFIFNWLVAAGYLIVGAATGFGDWSALFAAIKPDWMWRAPAGLGALFFYAATLRVAERLLLRMTGLGKPSKATLAQLVLVPTGAAALVAFAAQLYGQGMDPLGLELAFGCTLFIGLTLLGMGKGIGAKTVEGSVLRIGFNGVVLGLALLIGAGFILFIGPGAHLSAI